MIKLEMKLDDKDCNVRFEVPDQPGETLRVAELALFTLYLDVIKQRVTDLTSKAISRGEGYDLIPAEERGAKAERHHIT